MTLIEVHEASFSYTGSQGRSDLILDTVNFELHACEFVAIIGESGSGKSTFLDLLGLLSCPDSGDVTIFSQATKNLGEADRARLRRRSIGFVFQSFNLINQFSAIENVAVGSWDSRGNANEKARNLLRRFDLDEALFEKRPMQMSVGQRQRVAIARALINDPKIILCDEPTGNLDATNTSLVLEILHKLKMEEKGIVAVTHDNEIALAADRTLRLIDHKLRPLERDK